MLNRIARGCGVGVWLTLLACGGSSVGARTTEMGEEAVGPGDAQPVADPVARALLAPTEGNVVRGEVLLFVSETGTRLEVSINGLLANGRHGFHIHEQGDCSAPDGTSAGGHYNPEGHDHALGDTVEGHLGDLGNVTADANGRAAQTVDALGVEATQVIGRAFIVHAKADDGSQPTGGAGARVACGVIEALAP